jgi:hypothetical protein
MFDSNFDNLKICQEFRKFFMVILLVGLSPDQFLQPLELVSTCLATFGLKNIEKMIFWFQRAVVAGGLKQTCNHLVLTVIYDKLGLLGVQICVARY